jgi:hypothetical protein
MTVDKWNPLDPLAQVEGESVKANLALQDYALLGGGRSLRLLLERYAAQERGQAEGKAGAEKPPTTRLATLEEWSAGHRWQARVADYERLRLAERQARRSEREQVWEDKAWQTANALLEKAEQMLKFPVVETRTKDGQTLVIPARWSVDTIARLAQAADRLARLSTGAETEPQRVEGEWVKSLPAGVSPQEMEFVLDEIAAQVLEGLDTLSEEAHGDEPE